MERAADGKRGVSGEPAIDEFREGREGAAFLDLADDGGGEFAELVGGEFAGAVPVAVLGFLAGGALGRRRVGKGVAGDQKLAGFRADDG